MAGEKSARKWQLTAWPPGPRAVKEKGGSRSTVLWSRDYASPAAAYRAAPQVRRMYPGAQLAIMTFEFRGLFWHGDRADEIKLYWCACGGRLDWLDDMWHCPRCGSEWDDKTIREAPAR